MKYPYEVGERVRSVTTITEGGDDGTPDLTADFPHVDYVHSEAGGLGRVVDITDGNATVSFDFRGSATVVAPEEIELALD